MYTALGDRVLNSEDGCERVHVEAIKAAILSTLMQAHLRRGYFPQEVCYREMVYEVHSCITACNIPCIYICMYVCKCACINLHVVCGL